MVDLPESLRQRLQQYGQEHVLAGWDRLHEAERRELIDQLQALNLEELNQLYRHREQTFALPAPEQIAPIPVVPLDADDREARRLGDEALRRGEVAVLL